MTSTEAKTGTFETVFDFVRSTADAIPEPVLQQAAMLLLDTLGVAAGSVPLDAGRITRDFAAAHMAAPEDHAVPILFDGRTASPTGAAFATASQIDNLDAHDGFNPVKGHIGCAVVPALIAMTHHLPNLTGREALTAMVIGYEIAARAGIALHGSVSDYHTSGAWNALGVVATGAALRSTDADTLRHALGIAEYHGPRSQMMREIANPTMLHDGSGIGAMQGIMALELAQAGFTGAPAITIEDIAQAEIWSDLGTHWTLPLNYIKPYPVCRWAHASIDAARNLRLDHGFDPDAVERVTVRAFHEATRLFPGMPDTTSQAQYSLPFALASMIRFGHVGTQHIIGDALSDPQTADLVSRITMIEEPSYSQVFPNIRRSDITLHLKDGTELNSGTTEARGDHHTAMSEEELREKFDHFCAVSLPKERSDAIWQAGKSLLDGSSPFTSLTDHLSAPAS